MISYLDLLQNILDNGIEKESGRANMPNTRGISHAVIKMDMKDGFPLLTTKKMFLKGVIVELLWILKGQTNIKYLVDNNVHIWDSDSYRWYCKFAEDNGGEEQNCILKNNNDGTFSMYLYDEFIDVIKKTPEGKLPIYKFTEQYIKKHKGIKQYKLGDLGKVYGYQWRNQNGVDQVRDVIEGLQNNPYSRYHIIDAWQKSDFSEMALPPCHLLYQFIVRPLSNKERNEWYRDHGPIHTNRFDPDYYFDNVFLDKENVTKFYLDLNMYQRSVDTTLGCPFNIASMSLLLMIFAKTVNMVPGVATWIGGDTHIYTPHISSVKEQLTREPYALPELKINKELSSLEDILKLKIDDFELLNYKSHDKIKYELFAGLKK
jgi:thymidylate synthase